MSLVYSVSPEWENKVDMSLDFAFRSVKGSGDADGMLEDSEIVSQVRSVEATSPVLLR